MSDTPQQPPEGWGQQPPAQPPPAQPPPTPGSPPQGAPPAQPPEGWGQQPPAQGPPPDYGQPGTAQPPGYPPPGYGQPQGSWAPTPKRSNPLSGLLSRPGRELAGLAALLAAALVTLAALVLVVLLSSDDFDITFGDRIRIGTELIVFSVPLLLAAALLLRAPDEGAGSSLDPWRSLGTLIVAGVASVLLALRLFADLFAAEGGFGGFADRIATFLVDLAVLTLTLTLAWWAQQLRARPGAGGGTTGATPAGAWTSYGPTGAPPPPPAQQQWGQGYQQPGPGQGTAAPPPA